MILIFVHRRGPFVTAFCLSLCLCVSPLWKVWPRWSGRRCWLDRSRPVRSGRPLLSPLKAAREFTDKSQQSRWVPRCKRESRAARCQEALVGSFRKGMFWAETFSQSGSKRGLVFPPEPPRLQAASRALQNGEMWRKMHAAGDMFTAVGEYMKRSCMFCLCF